MSAEELQKMADGMADDREMGYRRRGTCGDCGAPTYQFFNRGTYSWSERSSHLGDNCVQYLRKRVEVLERAAKDPK